MGRITRFWLRFFLAIIAISLFLFVMPSLIGSLLGIMLVFAILDYFSRRYRSHARTLNSALRAVCHHDGAVQKVALAFSRSGPLSGECYEYTRRLMMGEEPVEAAVQSRVPLQLRTAIAMQTPSGVMDADPREESMVEDELGSVDSAMMPVYGQFVYLVGAAAVTGLVLTFLSVFILPTMEVMFDEFGLEFRYKRLFSTVPVLSILLLLAVIGIGIVPILNRGSVFGIRLPRWVPAVPRRAERKAEFLHGLADGFEAGWPIGRTLAVGHSIATRATERRSLDTAMRLIQSGSNPLDAVRKVGWLDSQEAAWLDDSAPARTADRIRTIADQNVRDSKSNLRWMMAIFFPLFVMMLGAVVMACAFGFFAILTGLTNGLS